MCIRDSYRMDHPAGFNGSFSFVTGRNADGKHGALAVSYTHLDVYKRQALHAEGQRFESVILHDL